MDLLPFIISQLWTLLLPSQHLMWKKCPFCARLEEKELALKVSARMYGGGGVLLFYQALISPHLFLPVLLHLPVPLLLLLHSYASTRLPKKTGREQKLGKPKEKNEEWGKLRQKAGIPAGRAVAKIRRPATRVPAAALQMWQLSVLLNALNILLCRVM